MFPAIRTILAILGVFLFVLGLLLVAAGGEASVAGLWPLLSGGVLLIAVVLEHRRYRSQAAERSAERIGPGGGEPDPLPAPFQPTDERFVDPTTGRVMRVHVDPRTGERRYRAEDRAAPTGR
jgi:hypothetical protein